MVLTMSLAIQIEQHGGPEVLKLVTQTPPPPSAGEVTLRHTAIGLNFIDTYQRSGLYPVPLPSGLGQEAAGVVTAVGAGVADLRVGDRVAYAGGAPGAYAQARTLPAAQLVKLPDGVSDEDGAVLMLKGMTAWYLLFQTHAVQRGETLLVQAAAGGVGSLLVPWAKHLGARVIGTAGGPDKCALAKASGCDEVIDYRHEDVATRVRELTGGRGVDVAYDSVGKDTWDGSLNSLRSRGLLVSYGNASGAVPPFAPATLAAKGSLYLTRPRLLDYTATREALVEAATTVFDAVARGIIRADIHQRYALKDAAQAHTDLESRKTHGASILLP